MFVVGLEGREYCFGAVSGDATARDIAALKALALTPGCGQGLLVILRGLLHRLNVKLGVSNRFSVFEIFAVNANSFDPVGSQAFAGRADRSL